MAGLGVNIDHIATIRQARQTFEPDPVWAAVQAELGGADGITVHLREDRRHIQDRDVRLLRETVQVKLNLEMAMSASVIAVALEIKPDQITLVPEKREEVTTEGGLDVTREPDRLRAVIEQLRETGALISLFIDPEPLQIESAAKLDIDAVELHTGQYADSRGSQQDEHLEQLQVAGSMACERDLTLHMGHGLTYNNVTPIAEIFDVEELNIGHSIVSRSVLVGMQQAVREMKALIRDY